MNAEVSRDSAPQRKGMQPTAKVAVDPQSTLEILQTQFLDFCRFEPFILGVNYRTDLLLLLLLI